MENSLTRYKKYQNQIMDGDVITFEGEALLSKIILKFTKRSHIASVVEKVGTDSKRRLIIEADQGEVNTRLLSEKLKNYPGKAYWHQLKPSIKIYKNQLNSFLWSHVGVKYDIKGLLQNIFKRPGTDPKALYCSEIAGASFYYPSEIKGFKAPCAIPYFIIDLINEKEDNKYLKMLLAGKVLRPGGIIKLPFFEEEIRIL